MGAIVALYAGDTISSARLIIASGDPQLVAYVAETLLRFEPEEAATDPDPAAALEAGRRRALRLVRDEALTELREDDDDNDDPERAR
jgi:hypothetical protein